MRWLARAGWMATAALLGTSLGAAQPPTVAKARRARRPAPRRILYVTQNGPAAPGHGCARGPVPGCFGFHHAVTEYSIGVLKEIGKQSGAFTVDATTDAAATLNRDNLRRYAAVVFYTTGEPPISSQEKKEFMDWLRAGHGFVGIHCATDTWYTWPEYHKMIGGTFVNHPWVAGSTLWVINKDPRFPSQREWPKEFQWTDEFYEFRDWNPSQVHVLLQLDPKRLDMSKPNIERQDHDFANSWVKYWGKGRVFYTAFGHDRVAWDNAAFRKEVEMGIRWADGEIPYRVRVP